MATREPVPHRELPVPGTIALSSESTRAPSAPWTAGARVHHETRIDWRVMLGLARGDSVLVLGGDSEQTRRRLAPWVRQVHSAPGSTRSCSEPAAEGVLSPAVIRHALSNLPRVAGSLDWIIVDGPVRAHGDLPATVALVLPALKPGGRVLVAFENRWGLGGRPGPRRRSTSVEPGGVPCRGLRHALDLMASAGCNELACYAVLPNHRAARTLIPLEPPCPPAAEKYALDQTWKRATPGRALGRLVLHRLIDMHLLRHLYPNYVVVGRKAC